MAGKFFYDRKKTKVLVVCLAGCAVVSVFGSGRKKVLVVHTTMYLEYHAVVVLCYFFWFWREIDFGVTYILSVQYSCVVVSVFLLWRESFITTGKKSSSCLSGRLCCCVSFRFCREIGFGCTYFYVLGVPYSCGVVLVIFGSGGK